MPEATFEPRRVVVALDASEATGAALAAAADLAGRLGAELVGLFVEDERLLRLAALPFARVHPPGGGAPGPLAPADVEAAFRAAARAVRAALAREADRRRVRSSLRVARGEVAEEVVAATAEGDLLVLGAAGPERARGAVGRTARAAAARARSAVLLVARGGAAWARVAAVVGPGTAPAPVLAAADRIAGAAVEVLAPAGAVPAAEGAGAARPYVHGAPGLASALHRGTPALVVVSAADPVVGGRGLERLVEAGLAVLLVRDR